MKPERDVHDETERLQTVIRSLVGPALRVAFLRDYLETGNPHGVARVFDAILADAPGTHDPVLALVMLLARLDENDPLGIQLREVAQELGLRNLERLLRRSDVPAPASLGSVRVPEYGRGRELSVGERRSLARAPSRRLFDKLLLDPHPLVIRQLLENPRLTEDDVIRLAAARPANAEVLRELARTEWLCRPRVRLALIQNPGTPPAIAVPLLGACTRGELLDLQRHSSSSVVRETAAELASGESKGDYPSSSSSSSQRINAPSVTFSAHSSQRGGSS